MVSARIFFIVIVYILFRPILLKAQDSCRLKFESIIENIYDSSYGKIENVNFDSTVIVVITQKNCIGCLSDVQILIQSFYPDYKIAVISILKDDPFLIPYRKSQIEQYFTLPFMDFYRFKDGQPANQNFNYYSEMIYQNSPFIIVKNNKETCTILDYSTIETMYLG